MAEFDCVDLMMLSTFPVISVPKNSPVGRLFAAACQSVGVEAFVPYEVTHASAAIAFARAGLGVAVVDPLSAPGLDSADLKVVKLSPTIEMTIQLALSTSDRPSRSTLKLISALRQVMKREISTSEDRLWATHWRPDELAKLEA